MDELTKSEPNAEPTAEEKELNSMTPDHSGPPQAIHGPTIRAPLPPHMPTGAINSRINRIGSNDPRTSRDRT